MLAPTVLYVAGVAVLVMLIVGGAMLKAMQTTEAWANGTFWMFSRLSPFCTSV